MIELRQDRTKEADDVVMEVDMNTRGVGPQILAKSEHSVENLRTPPIGPGCQVSATCEQSCSP